MKWEEINPKRVKSVLLFTKPRALQNKEGGRNVNKKFLRKNWGRTTEEQYKAAVNHRMEVGLLSVDYGTRVRLEFPI